MKPLQKPPGLGAFFQVLQALRMGPPFCRSPLLRPSTVRGPAPAALPLGLGIAPPHFVGLRSAPLPVGSPGAPGVAPFLPFCLQHLLVAS